MAWYNFWRNEEAEEKLNPAQPYYDHKVESSREKTVSYERAYEDLEIVNRGVNMIVDDCSEINVKVGPQTNSTSVVKNIKRTRVSNLLNVEPNLFQDISTFRRNLITDYLLDGNIFIYFDGVHLYHLPASKMTIHASEKTYIDKFTYNEEVNYSERNNTYKRKFFLLYLSRSIKIEASSSHNDSYEEHARVSG